MDYMKFVDYHRAQKADITIGCIPYGYDRASEFGLMKVCGAGHGPRHLLYCTRWIDATCMCLAALTM